MKHNNNFDFLRFLLSFLVVIGHSIILSGKPEFWNDFFAAMPNYSVYSFFVISGFLIYSSLDRLKDLKKYAVNRLKRILPAYVFVIVFFAIFLFAFSSVPATDYFSGEWLKYLGANLVFANFLKPTIPFVFADNPTNTINGSLWTIKVEIMFYVFVPILHYFLAKKSLRSKNIILLSLYIFSLTYGYFVGKYYNYEMAKQLPGSLVYFVSGIFLYLNFDSIKKNWTKLLPIAIVLGVLELYFSPFTIVFPFALGIFITWFAFSDIPLKKFGKHGDFSYGMYLIHFPIIQIFIHEKIYDRYSLIGLFASYIAIILFSILTWKFVESPFLRKRKSP